MRARFSTDPRLNGAEGISFGLGDDLRWGALIVDARQWLSDPLIHATLHPLFRIPPRRAALPSEDLPRFRAHDSGGRRRIIRVHVWRSPAASDGSSNACGRRG